MEVTVWKPLSLVTKCAKGNIPSGWRCARATAEGGAVSGEVWPNQLCRYLNNVTVGTLEKTHPVALRPEVPRGQQPPAIRGIAEVGGLPIFSCQEQMKAGGKFLAKRVPGHRGGHNAVRLFSLL